MPNIMFGGQSLGGGGVPANDTAREAYVPSRLSPSGILGIIDAEIAGTRPVFDVRDYGAKFDGVTNIRAGVEAAISAAVAFISTTGKGAVVQLPAGIGVITSTCANPPSSPAGGVYDGRIGFGIPVGLPARLVIRGQGRGVTTIKLADASARSAFWIKQAADYDTFQNVTLEDFDVDNNNATGRCHIVIGNMPAANTPQRRLNFADLTIRRIDVRNVPMDMTSASIYKSHVMFLGSHPAALEATQTSSRRIVVEDMRLLDGANGVAICSFGAGSLVGGTNHYYDQIHVRRVRHEITAVPTNTTGQTSFYICGTGYGDYFECVDCYSQNIADDGFEIGAMQRGLIANCTVRDAYLVSILFRNTHALSDVTRQQIVIRDFTHRQTAALAGVAGMVGRPVNWIGDNGQTFGSFDFDGFTAESDGLTYSVHGKAGFLFSFDTTPVGRRTFNRLKIRANYTYDATTGTVDGTPIEILTTSGTIIFRDLDLAATTTANGGSGAIFNLHGVMQKGTNNRVIVDGFDCDLSGCTWINSTGGALLVYTIGKTSGSGNRGTLRQLRLVGNYSSTGVGTRPLNIGNSTTIGSMRFLDADLGSASNLSADVAYSGTVNDTKLMIDNVIGFQGNRLGDFGRRRVVTATDTVLNHDGVIALAAGSTTQTETLPSAAAVPPGRVFTFFDETNTASATNPKVIQRAGTDTFTDGATSKSITTASGSLRVMATGTGWALV